MRALNLVIEANLNASIHERSDRHDGALLVSRTLQRNLILTHYLSLCLVFNLLVCLCTNVACICLVKRGNLVDLVIILVGQILAITFR